MSSSNPAHILLRRNSNVKDVVASPLVSANGGPEDIAYSNTPADYDLGQPIGYGSSAVVYIAKYKPANKRVAIKLIDLDQFERNQIDELRREIQIMSLSRHPNLLPVLGSFVHDSKLYIVTPFLSAGSCLDIMKTAYPNGLEESCIATILKQSLQGLEYLHKNGLIHRDVKAGNLLMDDDGLVQLADFGVSSSLMDTGERRGVRKTFVGTPCWMAPEVMEQTGYDHRADIWSFGITALELATGHAPFSKYPPLKVLMLTLQNDPPTLDREQTAHKYSKSFKDMIDSCLQKDPTKRPSAERLLNHAFFKLAPKRRQHLITDLIQTLPPVTDRPHNNRLLPKKTAEAKGVSWDFTSEIEALARSPPAGEDSSIAFSLSSISRLDPTSEKTPAPMTAPQNPSEVKEIKIGRFSVTESQAQPVTGDSAPVSPNMAPSASQEGSVVEGARPSRFTVVAADQPRHSASPPMSIQGSGWFSFKSLCC
ncbi:kinase-like domain-containing protein [Zopfochytrium polystomum]|nr:kinase-like domain-containing protein [Zopfochytrium polystomum]